MKSNRQNKRLVVAALCLAAVAGGCSRKEQSPQAAARPSVPVEVAAVAQRTMPLEVEAIGNVQAVSSVEVKSQVAAQVLDIHFAEGQDVKKGQLLFTLDRRPFEAELRRAEGTLGRDVAQARHAQAQAERYAALMREGVIAREQHDAVVANAQALEATVEADRAAVEAARLNLQYTRILAPMDGRTGTVMVHPGNVAKANDTTLVTINQISPIDVTFSLPEQQLPNVKRYSTGGKLKVEARGNEGQQLQPGSSAPAPGALPARPAAPPQPAALTGVLSFIDNSVDLTTGTIKLKATFPNRERLLWPGQFVNVVLTLSEQRDALVVPAQAVQTGQQGDYVYVIKPDGTAESRAVVVARSKGGESVIAQGLRAGEQVVTEGHLRLTPGTKVEVRAPAAAGGQP